MSCAAAQNLLEVRALVPLEPDEERDLAQHLEGCAACRAQADALDAIHRDLAATGASMPSLSDSLRERVVDAVDRVFTEDALAAKRKGLVVAEADPERVRAAGEKISLACSYCHDRTQREALVFCASCLAPHHAECFSEHGQCSLPGCSETATVRPTQQTQRRRWRRRDAIWGGLLAATAAFGAAAYSDASLARRTSELWRDRQEPLIQDALSQGGLVPSSEAAEAALTRGLARAEELAVVHGADFESTWSVEQPRAQCVLRLPAAEGGLAELADLARLLMDDPALADYVHVRGDADPVQTADGALELGLVLEVHAAGVERILAERERPQFAAISLSCEDTPLEVAVAQIAAQTGRTIGVDPALALNAGRITVDLQDAAWTEVLATVAETANCVVEPLPEGGLLLTEKPRVRLVLEGAPLREVLQRVAGEAGKQLAIAAEVTGNVDVNLQFVPWDEALLQLAREHGLHVYRVGGLYQVTTRTLPEAEPLRRITARSWIAGLAPAVAADYPTLQLDAVDLALPDLLDRISAVAGVPILADPAVGLEDAGADELKVTLSLPSLPWPEALALVAMQTRCTVEVFPGGALVLSQPPRVTLKYTDANLRTVLQLLATYAGKNVVIAREVAGQVTVDLHEVNWDQALLSLGTSAGFQVYSLGEVVLVSSRPVPGAERLRARTARSWIEDFARLRAQSPQAASGITLELEDVALDAAVERLQALLPPDMRLVYSPPTAPADPEFAYRVRERCSLDLRGATPVEAVQEFCERTELWFQFVGDQVLLRSQEETAFHAQGGDVQVWLQALATRAGVDLVVGPGVQGPLDLDLRDVSYLEAMRASVNALGLGLMREPSGVLRVQGHADKPPMRKLATTTPVGDLDLRLEALLLGASGREAVISGAIYQPGDALRDELGDERPGYRVEAIERDRVVVVDARDPSQERRHTLRF